MSQVDSSSAHPTVLREKVADWMAVALALAKITTSFIVRKPSEVVNAIALQTTANKGDIIMGKKFQNVRWYCDNCNARLDRQDDFDDCCGSWVCTKCGFTNLISEDQIYESERVYRHSLEAESGSTAPAKSESTWDKAKPILKKVGKGMLVAVGIVAVVASALSDNTAQENFDDALHDDSDLDNSGTASIEPAARSPRYQVEFKAFKTGDWYTKTSTDNIGSAYSVAKCHNYGRAYRITDTETNRILTEAGEDASMAECNGYPNGYPW